jgi:hypothetical protein
MTTQRPKSNFLISGVDKPIPADREAAAHHRFLTAFSALRPSTSAPGKVQQLQDLLEGFGAAYAIAATVEANEARQSLDLFPLLLTGYDATVEQWKEDQKGTADDFNLLEVMQWTGNELRHSMILAWMLDHDLMRLGTHAQGDLGFRLFLAEVGLPGDYASCGYRVRREVASDESRVDIEIAERGRFMIHIENKIWSGLGHAQLEREGVDMRTRAGTLGIPKKFMHGLYLTPDGRKPDDPGMHEFEAISWRQIARVFAKFASEAKPPDVQLFARHYAKVLRKHIIPDYDVKEIDNG